ncbi:MAG: aldehyde dehydrogenase family protein [Alphaproteobacteria bacterium]|nr:aldehyde dehydrogenase family protein [Alphaproteobacteria bacterium]
MIQFASLCRTMGIEDRHLMGGDLEVRSPITGGLLAEMPQHGAAEVAEAVGRAHDAFLAWREVPAPRRGELLRLFANELRRHQDDLARFVTMECGKILPEALGEVREMIDVCDFAVGLSRQLHGLTIASERPGHRMMETWHPLGPVGVITAFNFPVAVWAWNAALALVCGDPVVWKPSEKTPVSALACLALFERARAGIPEAPPDLVQVLVGGRPVGEALADDRRVPLVSATGSCAMGRALAPRVAARLGRTLLELGGNNAAIVAPSADLDLAVKAITFAAVGTAGQRCTSLRRLIVHEDVHDALFERLAAIFAAVPVGDPLDDGVLVGPLIEGAAYHRMQAALERAHAEGGTVLGGQRVPIGDWEDAYYARPALARMPEQTAVVRVETFAPILYVMRYRHLDEAIALNNDVPQGLSSSIFTNDLREAETFLSPAGSDCGIANVNIGPSGAEIGGAFGGEKDTGGGRESGSDSWRAYMRRATNTVNYSRDLPLAQGVRFGAE